MPATNSVFADRANFLRAIGAVHGVALQEHGRDHLVARPQVSQQFVQQITMVRPLPEVMVGIDNRQFGVKNWLRRSLGQPGIVRRDRCGQIGRAVLILPCDASDIALPSA